MKTIMNDRKSAGSWHYAGLLAALVGMLFFAGACSDDDEPGAGPAVAENCQQVYFPNDNASFTIRKVEDEHSIVLEVARAKAEGSVTVPVEVVSKSDGLMVPESVTFDSGATTAQLVLTVEGAVAEGTTYSYDIRLAGEHVDPYVDNQAGSSRFAGRLCFPQELVACCYFENNFSKFGNIRQPILSLGDGLYLIEDLMGGGVNLWLTSTAQGKLDVRSDFGWVDDYRSSGSTYYYWLLAGYNSYGPKDWTHFTPKAGSATITALEFYMDDSDYGWYNYWNEGTRSGMLTVYMAVGSDLADGRYPSVLDYFYISIIDDESSIDWSLPEQPVGPQHTGPGTVGEEFTFDCCFGDYYYTFGDFQETARIVAPNEYYFANFMNSGYALTIKMNEDGTLDLSADCGYLDSDYYYLYDAEQETYVAYYPNWNNGASDYLSSMEIYLPYGGWDTSERYAWLGSYLYLGDSWTKVWDYLYLMW